MSLPEHHSSDIPRHSLPGPGTEVLMKAGDMLYLPRGTIHEALAQSKFSTHITISVYQHYNMKKLLSNVVPRLIESAFTKNYEMRKGLPVWLSDKLGSLVGLEVSRDEEKKATCASNDTDRAKDRSAWRNALVLQIKDLVQSLSSEVCLALIDEAADEITGDFVMNRLPPPDIPAKDDFEDSHDNDSRQPHMGTSKAKAPEIKAETVIRMCDTRSMFCMVKELNGVSLLAMAHNKDNSRVTHMGHPDYRHFGDSEDGSDGEEEGEGEEGNDSQNESDGEVSSIACHFGKHTTSFISKLVIFVN
jgi:Cupin superfamily protein